MTYFVLFVSLFTNKMVGLELMGVLQLAFFTLSQFDHLNLYLSALANFKMLNGFNIVVYDEMRNDALPKQVSNMKMGASFLNNINVMILASYLYHFGACLCQIVIMCCFPLSPKCLSYAIKAKLQGTVILAIFNGPNVAFSTALHFKYFNEQQHILYNISCYINIGLVSCSIVSLIFAMCVYEQSAFG